MGVRGTEEIRVEEKKEEFLCPFSWSVHLNLAYNESTCCCAQAFYVWKQKHSFPYYDIYSAI
jgi:hypothetical protein